jgi:hypothetical protein
MAEGPVREREEHRPGDLKDSVERAIGTVLGWRRRPGRIDGVLTALEQAFERYEENGRVLYRHRPNIASFHSELEGGVVGAQASLHVRATEALNRSLLLLERLEPLSETADGDVAAAVKSVIATEFRELVGEFGRLGGPRVPRVDQLWRVLLGSAEPTGSDPDQVDGQLGELRDELGLSQMASDDPSQTTSAKRVNNAAEEQQVTSFRIIVDDLVSLQTSWDRDKHFFGATGGATFLGVQLVQLERELSVVAGSVEELRTALDSVFIDADERRTVRIPISGGSIVLEDLLDWATDFATQEGPRLVRDGGRLAIPGALLPAALEVLDLVDQAIDDEDDGGGDLGLHSIRVQQALGSLSRHLAAVVATSSEARPGVTLPPRYVLWGGGKTLGDWHKEFRLFRGTDGIYRSRVLNMPADPVEFKITARAGDGGETEYPGAGEGVNYKRTADRKGRHVFTFDPRVAVKDPTDEKAADLKAVP